MRTCLWSAALSRVVKWSWNLRGTNLVNKIMWLLRCAELLILVFHSWWVPRTIQSGSVKSSGLLYIYLCILLFLFLLSCFQRDCKICSRTACWNLYLGNLPYMGYGEIKSAILTGTLCWIKNPILFVLVNGLLCACVWMPSFSRTFMDICNVRILFPQWFCM